MKIKSIYIILLPLLFMMACVEEFNPEIEDYENLLVVDAMLSNGSGNAEVILSRSTPISSVQFQPEEGAEVSIIDRSGNVFPFYESKAGYYSDLAHDLDAETGKEYKLKIKTRDGSTYESKFQKIPKPVDIDKVYGEILSTDPNDLTSTIPGIQFYVDTKEFQKDSTYFMWKVTEDYKFNSQFEIEYIWDINGIHPFNNSDTLFTCYGHNELPQVYIYNTQRIDGNTIQRMPLHYVSTRTKKLTIRYSLLLNQYTINREAYDFFQATEDVNINQGDLFSTQPYFVQGNIQSTTDQNEKVLGYFTVSGKSEKRIFINRPIGLEFYYPECYLDPEALGFMRPKPEEFPIYLGSLNGSPAHASITCFDCTTNGASLEAPEFWFEPVF